MRRTTFATISLLATAAIAVAAEDGELPAPKHKASLVCFNGKADSQSSCRTTLAITEGGLRVVTSKLTCGHQGAVSEITWTYRGREGGKDVYHVARRFPADAEDAKTTEAVVKFDGKRHVLFEDRSQCIVIELQPQGQRRNAGTPIEGNIRETRVVAGVVYASVSVGSDDGVTRGMKLDVYGGRTGEEVVGTVEITAVEPEESIGRVAGPRAAEVRQNDRVRSHKERRREGVTEAQAPHSGHRPGVARRS